MLRGFERSEGRPINQEVTENQSVEEYTFTRLTLPGTRSLEPVQVTALVLPIDYAAFANLLFAAGLNDRRPFRTDYI